MCESVARAAPSCSNVLVVGEDGSGKGWVARELHDRSPRANGPFVAFDAGLLRAEDVEIELFGARGDGGKLAEARGGTLFLDEIEGMPLRAQARLARAVDRREELDVRIVSATREDLARGVRDGTFRPDLLHRLAVVRIELPPLRERSADVPFFARSLLRRHAATLRKNVRTITPDAMALLAAYSWPGNIRELSNVIEQAVVLATKDSITSEELPRELAATESTTCLVADEEHLPHDLEDATLAFQRNHVARVLASCGGHRARAARMLGISPATFFRHLRKLELKGPSHV